MTDDATRERIEQTETGYELVVTSTRGTGTRDQDKVKARAKTETLEQLQDEWGKLVGMVRETMNERRDHKVDEVADE